ncbi:hypothetical protein MVES1_003550 [Malassezia vespertilionis]|uniref:Uncharacterized protein n=1 Tax=Malassezia vespertilionis TaxID=2020962 RepID=A0A2N1J8P5_9BASI|nr:uncharacterized protein MVES1_003550 [Malassezia vespertilionis]PKI82832.1 hypothetical protein MVES_003127 [Malassezia vespertilionis]WFD08179.1 hypothetical protein MVES1_003550 [Malassezia vespertilionis]
MSGEQAARVAAYANADATNNSISPTQDVLQSYLNDAAVAHESNAPAPALPETWNMSFQTIGRSATVLGKHRDTTEFDDAPRPRRMPSAGVLSDVSPRPLYHGVSIQAWNASTDAADVRTEPFDSLSPISSHIGSVANTPNIAAGALERMGRPFSAFASPNSSATMQSAQDAREYFTQTSGSEAGSPPIAAGASTFKPRSGAFVEEFSSSSGSTRETHRVKHYDGFVLPAMHMDEFMRHSPIPSRSSHSRQSDSFKSARRESPFAQGTMPTQRASEFRVAPQKFADPIEPRFEELQEEMETIDEAPTPPRVPAASMARADTHDGTQASAMASVLDEYANQSPPAERDASPAPPLATWTFAAEPGVDSPNLHDRMAYLRNLGFQVERTEWETSADMNPPMPQPAGEPATLLSVEALNIQKPQTAEVGSSWSDAESPARLAQGNRNVSGVSFLYSPHTAAAMGSGGVPPPLMRPQESLEQVLTPALPQHHTSDWATTGDISAQSVVQGPLEAPKGVLSMLASPVHTTHQTKRMSGLQAPMAQLFGDAPLATPAPAPRPPSVLDQASAPLTAPPVEAPPSTFVGLQPAVSFADTSLSMLGQAVDDRSASKLGAYFDLSLQRVQTDWDSGIQVHPHTTPGSQAPVVAGRNSAPPVDPGDLFRNSVLPRMAQAIKSPVESMQEFTYILDDRAELRTPALGMHERQADLSTAPFLPPLDPLIPDEREVLGVPPVPEAATQGAWSYQDRVVGLFTEFAMEQPSTALPIDFVTKPNSVLSRGRPVKKTDKASQPVFYASLAETRHRRAEPMYAYTPQVTKPPFQMWNFEEDDKDMEEVHKPTRKPPVTKTEPSPQFAAHGAAGAPPEPQAKRTFASRKMHTKYHADEPGTIPAKRGPWFWRRGNAAGKEVHSEARTSESTWYDATEDRQLRGTPSPRKSSSTTHTRKHARRTAPPNFEPSQPGKYYLANTVSLPTLNIARTPEQRARNETGIPETEPALIQSLLAAPSSSTVRARAGIIKTIPYAEDAVPPVGQVLVAEERKILMRPAM